MPVIAEYRCATCGLVAERWTPSPPPAGGTCAACGGPSRRLYGFSAGGRAVPPAVPAAAPSAASPCRGNPDVPLLCHVDPAAAPGWIARYRKDNRALEAHLARAEAIPPAPAAGGGQPHGHSHGHRHGSTPTPGARSS